MIKQNKKIFVNNLKTTAKLISNGLNKFSANLLIKSLMTAMMQVTAFVIVGAIFLLMIAIPETIIKLGFNQVNQTVIFATQDWKNFSNFTSMVWNFLLSF